MTQITVKVRYDELPKVVRDDFLLEQKDRKIQKKELSSFLKETFVEPESLSFAFFSGNLSQAGEK